MTLVPSSIRLMALLSGIDEERKHAAARLLALLDSTEGPTWNNTDAIISGIAWKGTVALTDLLPWSSSRQNRIHQAYREVVGI